MSNFSKGSRTHNKNRYNDDFALRFDDLNGGNKVNCDTNFPSVNYTQDWSISFFFLKEDNTTQAIVDTRNVNFSPEAWEIAFIGANIVFVRGIQSPDQFAYTFNQYAFQNNNLYHVVFNFNSTTKDLSLYVNSSLEQVVNITQTIIPSSVSYCEFGEFLINPNIIPFRGLLRDFCVFDRQLTQREIKYIYETGVLPQTTHANCQFHIPFNHIPKVDGSNRLMLDVVKNYDYAKVSGATAYDGLMSGWTDDELGISNPSRIGAFKDFYTKNQYYGRGIIFDGGSELNYKGNIPDITSVDFSSGYTIVGKIFADTLGAGRGDLLQFTNSYLYFQINGTLILFTGANQSSNNTIFLLKKRVYTFAVTVTPTTVTWYVNGLLNNTAPFNGSYSEPSGVGIIGSIFNDRRLKSLYYIGVYNSILSESDIIEKSNNEDWLSLNPSFFYSSENNGTEYIDLSGNLGNATIQNPTYFQNNQRYVDYTGFEPRKKGLKFNGTNQYLEVQNMSQIDVNEGVTVICSVNNITETGSKNFLYMDDSNFNNVIRNVYTNSGTTIGFFSAGNTQQVVVDEKQRNFSVYRINNNNANNNGNYYDGKLSRVGQVNCGASTRTNSALARTDVTYSTFIGTGGGAGFLDCTIEYVAIFKGILNDREVKELYNNGLFSNPSINLQEKYDLELFIDFNNPSEVPLTVGGFKEDSYTSGFNIGTKELYFPDLSPKNYTIKAFGWNDLSDIQNSQVDL